HERARSTLDLEPAGTLAARCRAQSRPAIRGAVVAGGLRRWARYRRATTHRRRLFVRGDERAVAGPRADPAGAAARSLRSRARSRLPPRARRGDVEWLAGHGAASLRA